MPVVFTLMSIVGVIITVVGLASYAMRRRTGRSSAASMLWSIIVGGILAGPKLIIPVVLKLADGMISAVGGVASGGAVSNQHVLSNGWDNVVGGGSSSVSPSPSASTTAHNVPSGTIHSSTTPTPSTTSTPSPTSHDTSGADASQTWSHIWPWLLGVAGILVVIAIGIWLIAHANAKRAEIAEAAAAKREQRKREAEIKAQVDKDWSHAQSRHDVITAKWNAPDHDLATLLSMPAIRDVSVPTTAAAIEAIMTADELRTPHAPEHCTNAKTTDYVKAVGAADRAVTAAITYARRDALSAMSKKERDKLSLARQLLATAQNAAATPSERQIAYERVRALMDDLRIEVPERVMEAIETETRTLLERAHA